jgi:hypothetical protein
MVWIVGLDGEMLGSASDVRHASHWLLYRDGCQPNTIGRASALNGSEMSESSHV